MLNPQDSSLIQNKKEIYAYIQNHLNSLLREGEVVHYIKEQIIFYAGHFPAGLFIIKEGKISFDSIKTHHHLSLACSNEVKELPFLGYQHLISDTPYCKNCRAVNRVEAIFLPRFTVLNSIQSYLKNRKGDE